MLTDVENHRGVIFLRKWGSVFRFTNSQNQSHSRHREAAQKNGTSRYPGRMDNWSEIAAIFNVGRISEL